MQTLLIFSLLATALSIEEPTNNLRTINFESVGTGKTFEEPVHQHVDRRKLLQEASLVEEEEFFQEVDSDLGHEENETKKQQRGAITRRLRRIGEARGKSSGDIVREASEKVSLKEEAPTAY
jgi:hypothetical protein